MLPLAKLLAAAALTSLFVGCGDSSNSLTRGKEVSSAVAPDARSRAFVWYPQQSGLGATNSQPFEVWIKYASGDDKLRRVFSAERTAGVRLKWIDPRTLEICYGPSYVLKFENFFDHGEQHSQDLYHVEILLRRVSKLTEC